MKVNEIYNLIDNLKYSACRSTENMNDDRYIHNSQIDSAKEIVKAFCNQITRRNHLMLLAKMQSGKTGCCNAVCNIINETKLYLEMGIDKVLFISGMNDCGLKFQTYERLITQIMDANVGNVYDGKRSFKHGKDKKYYVLKNSDLLSYEGDINNALIFIDECHYGSNENNILTKFLVNNGIDWKNRNNLISRNTYIVSVSATPFDELISDTAESKVCVELKTDDEYVGVTDYVENGLVHNGKFNDTVGQITFKLADAIENMRKDNVCGVCIVRTRNFEELEADDFVKYNFDIHEMYSNGTKIEYDALNARIDALIADNAFNKKFENVTLPFLLKQKKQIKPLLVLIKGAFRAGITLNAKHKDYIYMVYDYSVKSAATAQALLGRMCGYRSTNTELKTHFYINDRFAEMYSNWEQDFSNRENIPADKVMYKWLDDNTVNENAEIASKSCGNFAIDLTDEEVEMFSRIGKNRKTGRSVMKAFLPTFFVNHGVDIEYNYLHEYLVKGKNNYKESSQIRRFDNFSETSQVYEFRAETMKDFIAETGRNFLTVDDLGKKCISVVLDAEVDKDTNKVLCGGNNRLLVYYSGVGQRVVVANHKSCYRKCKDTSLL